MDLSQVYDYENHYAMNFDDLTSELFRRNDSSNALLINALLNNNEEQRKKVFQDYIELHLSYKNYLYTLLMIRIGCVGDKYSFYSYHL